jgi:hypothetical protein
MWELQERRGWKPLLRALVGISWPRPVAVLRLPHDHLAHRHAARGRALSPVQDGAAEPAKVSIRGGSRHRRRLQLCILRRRLSYGLQLICSSFPSVQAFLGSMPASIASK